MVRGLSRGTARADDAPGGCDPAALHRKETSMSWQTPTATDFRFGFEITLYVAAR